MTQTPERRAFDLATDHIVVEKRWASPELRKAAPDSRTQSINPNYIQAKQLENGLALLTRMLDYLSQNTDHEDVGAEVLAPAELNSAWYAYAKDRKDVGRRILDLPLHDSRAVTDSAENLLGYAASLAHMAAEDASWVAAYERMPGRQSQTDRLRMTLGRELGHGALLLASAGEIDHINSTESLHARQEVAWEAGRTAMRGAHRLREEIGFDPTIDQLTSPYSPLVAHIHNSPHLENTQAALEYAVDLAPAA